MEDMHEMPQLICLHKSPTKQIKIGKTVEQKHLHWQYKISLGSY